MGKQQGRGLGGGEAGGGEVCREVECVVCSSLGESVTRSDMYKRGENPSVSRGAAQFPTCRKYVVQAIHILDPRPSDLYEGLVAMIASTPGPLTFVTGLSTRGK